MANSTLQRNQSTWPAPYQFTLISDRATVVCKPEPLEWNESIIKINRRFDEGGVFNMFMIDGLTFIGNGADHLTELFNDSEVNAECVLVVEYLNNDTMNYEEFPTRFSVKFHSYKIVKVGDHAVGVQVDLIQSSILQKFDDRKKVKLDLTKLQTLGGLTIAQFRGFPELSRFRMPALNSFENAHITGGFTDDQLPWLAYARSAKYKEYVAYLEYFLNDMSGKFPGYHALTLRNIVSDFAETQQVFFEGAPKATREEITPFFFNSEKERDMVVEYKIMINVTNRKSTGGDEPFNIFLGLFDASNNFVSQQSLIVNAELDEGFGSQERVYIISTKNEFGTFGEGQTKKSITVPEGYSLKMYIEVKDAGAFSNWKAYFNKAETWLSEAVVNTAESTFEGLPILECLTRSAQLMLDEQYPLYTDYFGRLDAEYLKDQFYLIENQERFAHIQSGVNIRGLIMADSSGGINIDWESLHKSVSAHWCTGYAIEWINERYMIRYENRDYFFNDTVILDISDRIGRLDIERQYIPKMAYVEILTGYESYVYESNNGRGEYNTEATRTTQINSPEQLDLKSDFNASTIAIANCLEKPIELTGSEDIDEDGDVFIIKSQREDETSHKWTAEFFENITVVNDSSPFKGSSLNLFLTPVRNMWRNAELFTPALQKQLGSKIRHQTSNKLQNLETTGEGYTVKENDDITIADFPTPKVKPIKLIITCEFTNADIKLLMTRGDDGVMNYYKKIRVSPTETIWIYGDISKKVNENKGSIEGILANE